MVSSPMGFRGDGASRAESSQQHRRTKSAADGFHDGFVKRLAGILDDHSKVIKSNADFLKEVSSTLRSHSYSSLPRPVYFSRPVSEPSLNTLVMNSPVRKQEDTSAVESSPGSMPPTPPDTPIVEITDWSCLPEKPISTKSSMSPPESSRSAASNQGDPSDREITTWYRFHAARAAKSLRYDCREVDLKLSHFIRRMNDLTSELHSLSNSNTLLSPKLTRKELSIRDIVQQEFATIRQTLHHYRKSRAHPLHLATTTANEVMPGFTSLEPNAKLRALHELYCRNKDISKPGDRKRYNEAMEILDACIAKDLNEEFVQKIDKWDQQVEVMRTEHAGASIV